MVVQYKYKMYLTLIFIVFLINVIKSQNADDIVKLETPTIPAPADLPKETKTVDDEYYYDNDVHANVTSSESIIYIT